MIYSFECLYYPNIPLLINFISEKKCIIAGEESSGEEDNVIDEKSNGIIDIAHCSKVPFNLYI